MPVFCCYMETFKMFSTVPVYSGVPFVCQEDIVKCFLFVKICCTVSQLLLPQLLLHGKNS